jgi:polyisoprenoid-binding protein YceI
MTQPTVSQATWTLDVSHSVIEFSVKHMMIANVKGRFASFTGTITGNLPDLTGAQVQVTVDAASIDTRDAQRDAHLRSADFFDVERFPTLTLVSKRIERTGENTYDLVADLTIHGVTREVVFHTTFEGEGKDPWGNQRVGFTADAQINRKDFGLTWNVALEAGGILVGETVKIHVEAQAIRQG